MLNDAESVEPPRKRLTFDTSAFLQLDFTGLEDVAGREDVTGLEDVVRVRDVAGREDVSGREVVSGREDVVVIRDVSVHFTPFDLLLDPIPPLFLGFPLYESYDCHEEYSDL